MTDGFDVFVQLVIAAMTTWPWSSSVFVPSARITGPRRRGARRGARPRSARRATRRSRARAGGGPRGRRRRGGRTPGTTARRTRSCRAAPSSAPSSAGMKSFSAMRNAACASVSVTRSCGRLGPASDGTTVPRSSSMRSEYAGSTELSSCHSPCSRAYASTSATSSGGAARELEVAQRLGVDREDRAGRAELRAHVADRRAVGERQVREPLAVELDELADDAALAQHLGDGQHEVGRRRALGQLAVELEAEHLRDEHRHRLAEHRRLGLDPADAPAEHAEAVDHRRVRVGPDERVGVGDAVGDHDDAREVLQVDLVDDPRVGRHDGEVVERVLAPAQEGVTLLVALELALGVGGERAARAVRVDLHGVVDDELRGNERVDHRRVAAHGGHRVAHRREVDDGRHAREVLHDDARRRERDLLRRLRRRVPRGERLDVRRGDRAVALRTQEVLEQDLQRERQPCDVERRLQGVERVDVDRALADGQRAARIEAVGGCGQAMQDTATSMPPAAQLVDRREPRAKAVARGTEVQPPDAQPLRADELLGARGLGLEVVDPVGERARVVRAEALDVQRLEARALERELHAREQLRRGVREDVALGEAARLGRRGPQPGDAVVQQPAAGSQQRGEALRVEVHRISPTCSTMPMLAIASKVSLPPAQLAVVGDADLDAVADAGRRGALARQARLRLGQRDPDDPHAVARARHGSGSCPTRTRRRARARRAAGRASSRRARACAPARPRATRPRCRRPRSCRSSTGRGGARRTRSTRRSDGARRARRARGCGVARAGAARRRARAAGA